MKRLLYVGLGLGVLIFAPVCNAGTVIIQQFIPYESWQMMSTTPASNQSLAKPPESVSVTLSQAPNKDGSFIQLLDPYNSPVQTGDLVIEGTTMYVKVPPLKDGYAGTYHVRWQAACACTDSKKPSGDYYFNIR